MIVYHIWDEDTETKDHSGPSPLGWHQPTQDLTYCGQWLGVDPRVGIRISAPSYANLTTEDNVCTGCVLVKMERDLCSS